MDQNTLSRLKHYFNRKPGFKLAVTYLVLVLLLAIFLPWLPLKYPPQALDLENTLLPPFFQNANFSQTGHWLGTDQMGRDVMTNLLYGFRTAFSLAVPVMVIAMVLGTLLGSAAGFFGNLGFKISWAAVVIFTLWLPAVLFYAFYLPAFSAATGLLKLLQGLGWFIGLSGGAFIFVKLLKTLGYFGQKVPLPLDELVLKMMEILSSVPRLVLVLSFSALTEPGLGNILLLLSLTLWAGPARLVRAEVLKIKQLPYIEAARVSGLGNLRILFGHILPNAAAPLWVAFSFGLSALLGMEATLSFLGIGLPPEMPSWGRMLAGSRLHPEAWWLVIFPAVLLCLTILSVQTCGNYLKKSFTEV